MEYLKLELISILPQILDASKKAISKHKNDPKKLLKAQKKLLKIVKESKYEIFEQHQNQFSTGKEYEEYLSEYAKTNSAIGKIHQEIENAINYAL